MEWSSKTEKRPRPGDTIDDGQASMDSRFGSFSFRQTTNETGAASPQVVFMALESDSTGSDAVHVSQESTDYDDSQSFHEAEEIGDDFRMQPVQPQVLSLQSDLDVASAISATKQESLSQSMPSIMSTSTVSATDKRPKYSGAILSLTLKNFMCHSHKEFRFHEKINIITGRNGSGKSAIVAGIIICLGARANITKRASELEGLCKDGCKTWEVTVVLSNEGWNPYKMPLFGNKIFIKRSYQNGRTMLKISGENGQLISKRYQDLDSLKNHFGIQIDNPCNIMDQDASRAYIRSATPEKQYEMFSRAMLLQKIEQDIQEIRQHVTNAEYNISLKKEILNRQKMATSIFDQERASLTRLEDQLKQVEKEAVWAKIIEAEDVLNRVDQELTVKNSLLDSIDAKLVDKNAKTSSLNQELMEIDDTLKSAKLIYSSHQGVLEPVNDQILRLTIQISENMASIRSTNERCQQIESLLREKQRQMEQNLAARSGQVDIKVFENRLAELQSKQRLIETQITRLPPEDADPSTRYNREIQDSISRRAQLLKKVSELKELSANIRSDAERIPAMLHWKMPSLLRKIRENAKRFQSMPIGPLGLHFRITSKDYIKPVVSCLQKAMCSFIVENYHDESILKLLAREVGSYINVIIRKREARLQLQPPKMYPRLFPLINHVLIMDDFVRDTCVDVCQIESAYVASDYESAFPVMTCNPGLNKIYLQDGRIIQRSKNTTVVLPANNNINFVRLFQEEFDIQNHHENQRKENELQLQFLDNEISLKQDELRAAMVEFDSNKNARIKLVAERNEIRKMIMEVKETIQEAKDIENNVDDQFIQGLRIDLADKTERLRALQEEMNSLEREKDSCLRKRKKMEQDLQSASSRISGIEEQRSAKQNEIDLILPEVASMNLEIDRIRAIISKLKADYTEKSRKLKHDQEEAFIKYGSRLQTSRNSADCVKHYLRLRDAIEKETKRFGIDRDAVNHQMERKRKLDEFDAKINKMEGLGMILMKKAESCEKNLIQVRTSLGRTINIIFGRNLLQKDLSGRIEIDHNSRVLNMKVNPNAFKEGNRTSNINELSGGERSFTTVSFLISLWSEVYSPFVIADELDVYMDDSTRKVSLNMILQYCRSLGIQRQFIFVSPLDMSFIERRPDIGILEMLPPNAPC